MADDRYVVDSGEYVRTTPLPSTGLFDGVDVDAMLELTRRTIAARRPEVTEQTALTRDEAAAALRAGAWTETPGLDDAAPRLLAAVKAVRDLCRDDEGNPLSGSAGVPVRDLAAALALAGGLPEPRTIVHCYFGGFGADWDLDSALDLVATAWSVEWSRSLFAPEHDLLVTGADGKTYRLGVPMPGGES